MYLAQSVEVSLVGSHLLGKCKVFYLLIRFGCGYDTNDIIAGSSTFLMHPAISLPSGYYVKKSTIGSVV